MVICTFTGLITITCVGSQLSTVLYLCIKILCCVATKSPIVSSLTVMCFCKSITILVESSRTHFLHTSHLPHCITINSVAMHWSAAILWPTRLILIKSSFGSPQRAVIGQDLDKKKKPLRMCRSIWYWISNWSFGPCEFSWVLFIWIGIASHKCHQVSSDLYLGRLETKKNISYSS